MISYVKFPNVETIETKRRTVVIRGWVWGDVGQKVQTLCYKINKFWRPSGQHGDYN